MKGLMILALLVKKIYVSVMILSLVLICFLVNYSSLQHAKQSCIESEKTPMVEKTFLAFNWSVSCK